MHAGSAFAVLNEGDKLYIRWEAEITSYSVLGIRKLSAWEIWVSVEMLWKTKDGAAISRINTLRNLRCLNTLGSLLRFLFSFYAKTGCMQCYSALTVSLKRPVVMPITEVSMKTSTGFIRIRAKRYCVSLQQGQIKSTPWCLGQILWDLVPQVNSLFILVTKP